MATCSAHCPPTDGTGRALQSCKGVRDGVFDASDYRGDFTKGGAPALECNYIAPGACGCGTSSGIVGDLCVPALREFPCGELTPDAATENSFKELVFADEVCAKYCSYPSSADGGIVHTRCGPGHDANGALVLTCFADGCPGRRPEGLADVTAARGEPVGAYFADSCHMEAASVHSFAALREELLMHGAPSDLVARAERAEADEVRHARMTARLARRFGAEEGAWAEPPEVAPLGRRSLEAIALENAVEGCVNETFAALLAMWQAEHARDRSVRDAMRAIAEDETRHAALARSVAQWLEPRLDGEARRRVEHSLAEAVGKLARLTRTPSHALVDAGLAPAADQQDALVRALVSTLEMTRPNRVLAA